MPGNIALILNFPNNFKRKFFVTTAVDLKLMFSQ